MATRSEFVAMRRRLLAIISDDDGKRDERLRRLVDTSKEHHAAEHHLSGIEGASKSSLGSGTRRSKATGSVKLDANKASSSYFIDDDHAMDAIFDMIQTGMRPNGKRNVDVLAGFLLNAEVGARLGFDTTDPDDNDPYLYGYSLCRDTSPRTPHGAAGAIREVEAHAARVVVQKTSEDGDFEIYNIYPVTHPNARNARATRPSELQKKLEATTAYQIMPPVRQMETSLRVYQRDDTPSVSVRDGMLQIDFTEVEGPVVRISEDHIESDGCATQAEVLKVMRESGLGRQASAVLQLSKSCHAVRERSPIMQTIMEPGAQVAKQRQLV